ncbi:hypothetical protein IQ250_26945 [Pseudanabaenaceae cyanobacterium LEGE 13415]|nr:hypothetical protein [Pseudanabaenaceae cyanobacterium LEGE 13415]
MGLFSLLFPENKKPEKPLFTEFEMEFWRSKMRQNELAAQNGHPLPHPRLDAEFEQAKRAKEIERIL